jgi:hypothetical protein
VCLEIYTDQSQDSKCSKKSPNRSVINLARIVSVQIHKSICLVRLFSKQPSCKLTAPPAVLIGLDTKCEVNFVKEFGDVVHSSHRNDPKRWLQKWGNLEITSYLQQTAVFSGVKCVFKELRNEVWMKINTQQAAICIITGEASTLLKTVLSSSVQAIEWQFSVTD